VRTRILHVSDIHIGARNAQHDPEVERTIGALVERLQPELVIASGDLTHRGRRDQHMRAAQLLRELETPLLVVPGNHDIPYSLPARFSHPWREFERQWDTTEPVYSSPAIQAVGVNSVRPSHHQSGGVPDAQLGRVAERLVGSQPGALRIVALHHQLVGAPWRTRKRPVARRSHVLAGFIEAGADLIVGGHIHQAAVSERHEFEVVRGQSSRPVVISIAPGFGQPRPRRRGEARGVMVYTADDEHLAVETYLWNEGDWNLRARRTFPRAASAL
jgi:3',5'-cyclic AMP phosphodiesterase CpdA